MQIHIHIHLHRYWKLQVFSKTTIVFFILITHKTILSIPIK